MTSDTSLAYARLQSFHFLASDRTAHHLHAGENASKVNPAQEHVGKEHGLSPVGRSLRAFKDRGDRYAGRCLCRLFAEACSSLLAGIDVVVPVPSDLGRLHRRGLGCATWLAKAVSRQSGVPLQTTSLRRLPDRPPQRGLGGRARRINAVGAFALGPSTLRGYSVLLTDDVATTGATLNDAARCLREAGATKVVCAVLACADEEVIRTWQNRIETDGRKGTGRPVS